MPQKTKSLCAICGKEEATTRDHIPPKGIFAKPFPKNLITVPACLKCNNRASRYDEAFRVDLSLHVGVDTPETQKLWEKHVLKTLGRQTQLRKRKLNDLKPEYSSTSSGIIEQYVGLWDSEAHDIVVERIIRGLYYHHFNEVLGDKVTCSVQWLNKLTKELDDLFKNCPLNNLGNDQFIYRYIKDDQENPLDSLWIFQFYKRHFVSGYTTPVGEPE